MILQGSERCIELALKLQKLMIKHQLTLGTAESCTGGLLASLITHHSGSSKYYLGGVSSYSNYAKQTILHVKDDTLKSFGAVSEETAKEMSEGVLKVFNADYGISITGIAGPSGGSVEKPVGTIFVGISGPNGTYGKRFQLDGDRLANRSHISYLALDEIFQYTCKNIEGGR